MSQTRTSNKPDPSTFAALKNRDFLYLWIGILGSAFALNMQLVAQGWLVYEMTTSAMKLAWVTMAFMLPQVFLSLLGGVLADRLPKKPLLMVAQAANGVATAIMAVIIFSGTVTFWDFIWVGAVNGSLLALSVPARTAFIPELVGESRVFNAMAFNTAGWNLARIIGPAIAGFMIAIFASGDTTSEFGVGMVYVALSILYVVSSVTILFVSHSGKPSHKSGKDPLRDVVAGVRYVLEERVIGGLILLSIMPFLFGLSINTLLPAVNRDVFGGGPDDLGYLMTAMGVGAIFGSLVIARLGELRRKGFWVLASCAGWGAMVSAVGVSDSISLALVTVAAVGFIGAVNMSMNRSITQLQAIPEMRGRVMSIDMMTHGLLPVGMLPISWIAEHYSVQSALVASGLFLVLATLILSVLLGEVRRIDRGYREG